MLGLRGQSLWLVLRLDRRSLWLVLRLDRGSLWSMLRLNRRSLWLVLRLDHRSLWLVFWLDSRSLWLVLRLNCRFLWVVLRSDCRWIVGWIIGISDQTRSYTPVFIRYSQYSRDPILVMMTYVNYPCCGKHGWVREGMPGRDTAEEAVARQSWGEASWQQYFRQVNW